MNRLILLFALFSVISCKAQIAKNDIQGIWIHTSRTNEIFPNDTLRLTYGESPIVYDFMQNGELVLNDYKNKDTLLRWFLKSDSILTIDSTDYFIQSLTQDRISLIDSNQADIYYLTFRRPQEVNLDYNKTEIEKILLANTWTYVSTQKHGPWVIHFEYFDNKAMISRYKLYDRSFNDTMVNLHNEWWGIAEYKGYIFLYHYSNDNLVNRINQIIDINQSSFAIDAYDKIDEITYNATGLKSDNQRKIKQLKGNWKSFNSKDKTYGEYIPERYIERGHYGLYEGNLDLSVEKDTITLKFGNLEPFKYTWLLSKDGKSLILESHIDDITYKGVLIEYVDIMELTDTKLKIRLFYNFYMTGMEKPVGYYLNLIQEFEKVE